MNFPNHKSFYSFVLSDFSFVSFLAKFLWKVELWIDCKDDFLWNESGYDDIELKLLEKGSRKVDLEEEINGWIWLILKCDSVQKLF